MKLIFNLFLILFLTSCFDENKEKQFCGTKSNNQIRSTDSTLLSNLETINQIDSTSNDTSKWVGKLKKGTSKNISNYTNGILNGEQIEYYKNKDIRFKENYINGQREGYQFDYYEGKSEIFVVSYYKNDKCLWTGFPLANEKFIIPLKDFHIKVDSVYVVAPYNNGQTWYEGTFINRVERNITGKRVGIHKVYHKNGQLKAILNYKNKRITEYDSIGTILRNNDTFENGTNFPINYKK